ncbi:MAG: aspartate ammonia-lyase [Endomicrobiales bacterium]
MDYRIERDFLGEKQVPADVYWGIHTQRARENFSLSGSRMIQGIIVAYAMVKKACGTANRELGFLNPSVADAIVAACDEIIVGRLQDQFPLDPFQGGAGTSLNMNLNEVIANRAEELLAGKRGDYLLVHPLDHVNLHQSTNDTFPTAVKVAVIYKLRALSGVLATLQGALQNKEKEFAGIVKMGRTELQEAVPMTLGSQFSGFAEAVGRDRWRTFKCEERIRTVNLGLTAVGTGICAPREYIFLVVDKLRELTGMGLSRAENGVDQTSNADAFAEIAGILNACAVNLMKIANDLRLLNLIGEIHVEALQAGSSIMPAKTNPVILESIVQVAMRVMSNGGMIVNAASAGTQQINEFMPLISHGILESLDLLINSSKSAVGCISTITAHEDVCRKFVDFSPSMMTAFVPVIGYQKTQELIREYKTQQSAGSVRDFLKSKMDARVVDEVLSPHKLAALGFNTDESKHINT